MKPNGLSTGHRIAIYFPLILIGIGISAIAGWALDSALLKSIIPGLTAMNPLTAVAFILSGIALWFALKPQFRSLAQLFALIIVVITLLKFADLVFGWGIGIDHVLFAGKLDAESVPNRMAPNTALNFLLAGAAIFLTCRNQVRWSRVAQAFTLFALFITVLAVLGYAYEVLVFYSVLTFIPMALNTAVTFLILCLGILSIQPDVGMMAIWRSQGTSGVLARRLTLASVLVLLITGWVRLAGGRSGVFDAETGEALFAIVNSLLLIGVIWWTAQVIERADQKRRRSEAALSRSEAALRESEARYRTLFENSSDGIIVVGADGRFLDANLQAERLTGYTHDELLHIKYGDLTANIVAEAGQAISRVAPPLGSLNGEHIFVHQDGTRIAVEFTSVTVAPGLYEEIFHDISERKKAEERLRESLEKERRLNELKSQFVSMVSHEFRTPLAVIRSSTDLLLSYADRITSERRQERLVKIQQQISVMVQLLDDILSFRRVADAGVVFNPELLDLSAFCIDLIAEIQPAMPSHRIEFASSGNCGNISADPKLMRQAITNLISNAIKYSPGSARVQLDLFCGESEIILHVRDEGIGISQEDQAKLFEAFFRASNVGSIPGTGLGLAIVKQVVEAHGGSIACASEQNVGTTFTISLPRRAA